MGRLDRSTIVVALMALASCARCDHPRGHHRGRLADAAAATATVDAGVSIDAAAAAGATVYDPTQRVYWLADANLAGDPAMRAALGVAGVNADGTMTYATAVRWIAALNAYDGGAGYLGHRDWQLPVTPPTDPSCAVEGGNSGKSFGPGCTGSALGQLFTSTLGGKFPEGFGDRARNQIGPFRDLQQGLYWTAGTKAAEPTPKTSPNAYTFTFTSGGRGRNTTRANYFYVLPVVHGAIGAAPVGTGLVPYTAGPAAGLAVYDSVHDRTWPVDGSLAASSAFGVAGAETLSFQTGYDITTATIIATGAMRFPTAAAWLRGMNAASYAGASTWSLPTVDELRDLHAQLAPAPDALLVEDDRAGFHRFQRFFYWACQRAATGDSRAPCDGTNPGPAPNGTEQMQWAFNFQTGFQGTDEESKEFFVVPYYPAP
ncbi:MAG: DUF1566 domain-containing protein [Myxococcales bacterium]|nr:DUF1566 domain-containing protein [Myxococcales bacterium]